jgi:hypothetical protein
LNRPVTDNIKRDPETNKIGVRWQAERDTALARAASGALGRPGRPKSRLAGTPGSGLHPTRIFKSSAAILPSSSRSGIFIAAQLRKPSLKLHRSGTRGFNQPPPVAGFQPRHAAPMELELGIMGGAAINMPLLPELSHACARIRVRCRLCPRTPSLACRDVTGSKGQCCR